MGYFLVRYNSRVVNYNRRAFIRLTTGHLPTPYVFPINNLLQFLLSPSLSLKYDLPSFFLLLLHLTFCQENLILFILLLLTLSLPCISPLDQMKSESHFQNLSNSVLQRVRHVGPQTATPFMPHGVGESSVGGLFRCRGKKVLLLFNDSDATIVFLFYLT